MMTSFSIELFSRRFVMLVLVLAISPAIPLVADDDPKSKASDELTPEANQAVEELTQSLSAGSEAQAMLDQILQGSRLGPGEGWFALAQPQSRFPWQSVLKAYDSDEDLQISTDEFNGAINDFTRLDRDGDNALTESDFDWSEHSLARTPGLMLFFQADRDANGKITRQEFEALFESLDSGSRGFVALDDVRDEFQPPPEDDQEQQRERRPDRPSRSTLILGLQRQEIGSLQPGPNLNDAAPDFTLASLDGRNVTLSDEVGERPIVLIFGNFTCGPFRSQAGNIEKLYERYRDRAKFFLVYVREAHPSDGWWMTSNERVGIDLTQPTNDQQRREVAESCRGHLQLDIPFLVDTVDDKVGSLYSGMPNRLYLIDREGRIAFKNGRGPFGFHPRQLEQALVLLLHEQVPRRGE